MVNVKPIARIDQLLEKSIEQIDTSKFKIPDFMKINQKLNKLG